ncbi:hypothetical protein TOPH_05044 [Tolypocladium ophioglossoides CBS 100239]|uniref:RSE1/DDB1/CPSF1 first beta-propeller domain-containing protein n=1 Tax=Tolypocladium ophioglossoides (strain CBS 100239) TaxID=1163406 RepID=A0A0L0N8K1_TOLOC|nr:hypothetical protein TOPH_05044 [Tolypocladium ophioglossoides CBS 100239]
MAFQTSFLRDGEWVTATVNFQAALQQATAPAPGPTLEPHPEPPTCGILSKTVVESPIVHWILPERFVQISELRRDGQIHEVARKNDFGSRIRSALVLGDPEEHGLGDETPSGLVESEDPDSSMPDALDAADNTRSRALPPQLLVLMLDSGDCIFLFLGQQADASLKFVLNTYSIPKKISYLGYHFAVDPSSRYMAAASPDGVLVMYELEETAVLNAQYMSRGSFTPVKSVRLRVVQGVIHKLEFLYPRPEDDYHIILILIVIRKERGLSEPVTRMVTYEWEVGDSLKEIFAQEKLGSRLPKEHKMPLLLIPLRFNTALFTLSESFIGIVKDCLSGSPVFESLRTDPPSQTELHHGAYDPLWTAWARPFRRKKYFENTDIIYLAREDGAIIHVEIEATDLVPSVTNVGCVDSNINTAFATAYDVFSDILIIGGDSGPGGIWKLAPRTELEQASILPNWSPVVDVATTTGCSTRNTPATGTRAASARQTTSSKALAKPDSVFTASGRGANGSVTQWRRGIQGRIGLDIESGEPIRQSWAFKLDNRGRSGLCALLALPHSSVVLQFSEDFSQVDALTAEDAHFDIASRTLDACRTPQGMIVQVTERSVTLVTGSESSRFHVEELLGIDHVAAENAFCADDTVIISTHGSQGSQVHTLLVTPAGIHHGGTWDVQGEVTCVSLFTASESKFVITGSVLDGTPWISIYSSKGEAVAAKAITGHHAGLAHAHDSGVGVQFEPLTSICVVRQDTDEAFFTAGTRCGHLLNVKVTGRDPERITWVVETIGVSPVEVFAAAGPFEGGTAALMCCDDNLVMMTEFSPRVGKFQRKQFVWLTDANDASMPSPPAHSVCSMSHNLSGYAGHMSLMVQAGSRLLLASIWPHVGLVPRSIPVEGTPTRIIYSQTRNCLVVALLKGDRPTLAFIDPESGETISVPSDKDGKPSEFVSGLGHSGDRIYGLYEWLYVKDGKTFSFILVSTKDGRLLIVSVNKIRTRADDGRVKRLHYWTRYKKVLGQPIYSVVGDDQGIIFCVDRTIHWEVLDLAEKKLRPINEYDLDSPATSLRVVGGNIFALTTMHSMEVIDYKTGANGNMELVHSDQISRRTVHMIDAGHPADRHSGWPVTLLSDQSGGIAGIWVPWRQRNKEFDVVFEGMLPASVRRFTGARSRPLWLADGRRPCYGTLPSTGDGADILGVSLDGSLQHFTLIGLELWRFLYLVQNMARRSPETAPLADAVARGSEQGVGENEDEMGDDGRDNDEDDDVELEPEQHAKLMHIDGDVLERCLRRRALERMVRKGDRFVLFCGYLDQLEGGRHTDGFRDETVPEKERRDRYLGLGY